MGNFVIVAGGINVDIKGKSFDSISLGSSNPGAVETTAGGVGRNIAHNLALLNIPVILLSAVGSDTQGLKVLEETSRSGVCTDYILRSKDYNTGTYIALLDNQGEMILALSDMQILNNLDTAYFQKKLDLIKDSKFIICDTNIPIDSIRYLKETANVFGIPIFIEPVSVAKAQKLKNCLQGIDYITPNLDELMALSGYDSVNQDMQKAAQYLIDSGVKNVITTLGQKGLYYTSAEGNKHLSCINVPIKDVTGAGDSLTAGFIYGIHKYNDVEKALKCGLAAAAITIGSEETVSSKMSEKAIEAVLLQYSLQQI